MTRARDLSNRASDFVSVKDFGAVGDGVVDDTAAIQAADTAAAAAGVALQFVGGTYKVTSTLTQTTDWLGVFAGSVYNENQNPVIINKTNGNTNGNKVIKAGANNIGCYYISLTVSNPPNYYAAVYPTGSPYDTTNPDYGFYADNNYRALIYKGCSATGFRVAGFNLESGSVVSQIELCDAKWNNIGIILGATDCQIINSTSHHNTNQGIKVTGNYARLINNRVEWNAYEGVWMVAGEFTVVGNLFDRNGKAGIYLDSAWGGTVTGNYFSRNGGGGNGSVGRWGTATIASGAAGGYVTLSAGESCHIRIKFQRAVTIVGNRYRQGADDSDTGSFSPAYIYSNDGANENIIYNDNAGEYGTPVTGAGYNASYPSGGSGIIYGGSIADAFDSNKGRYITKYGKIDNDGAGGTIGVPILQDNTFGEILVNWTQYPNGGVTKVNYYYYSVFGSYTAKTDLLGTGASASLTLGITSSTLSGVTITGTAGQFSCTADRLYVGQKVVISGTFGGTGSITGYSNPTTYYIIATNGTTTFTLSASLGGTAIVTTAGTPTGLTYTPTRALVIGGYTYLTVANHNVNKI